MLVYVADVVSRCHPGWNVTVSRVSRARTLAAAALRTFWSIVVFVNVVAFVGWTSVCCRRRNLS